MKGSSQLELSLFKDSKGEETRFILTRALLQYRNPGGLLKKLSYVRRFFPELDGKTIKVGLTRCASGMAVPGGEELWFNPKRISHHTIAHEFVHLLQGENGLPRSERSCDLFSLARHWTLNDTQPYYLRIPASLLDDNGMFPPQNAKLVYEAAVEGLKQRSMGMRNYISFFEKTLESLAAHARMYRF